MGELAKAYFAGGIDIDTLDYEEALSLTQKYMAQDEVILYEPAFKYKNLFVRVDILVKKGSQVYIYEVKAKSFDINEDSFFTKKQDGFLSGWKPYIYDIAFQNYVVSQALAKFEVFPHLTLADKTTTCSVDGLNQKFPISKGEDGNIKDPYKLLPKIFEDIDAEDEQKLLNESEELRNGAAAMTAYARMQFTQMSNYEKESLTKALLKYCELDTFAMVLILEEWINECKN